MLFCPCIKKNLSQVFGWYLFRYMFVISWILCIFFLVIIKFTRDQKYFLFSIYSVDYIFYINNIFFRDNSKSSKIVFYMREEIRNLLRSKFWTEQSLKVILKEFHSWTEFAISINQDLSVDVFPGVIQNYTILKTCIIIWKRKPNQINVILF